MIERLRPAETILIKLGIAEPKDIDLEAIAWTLGAAVKYRALDKCEAMIVGSRQRAIITVNNKSIPTRRRFSIAHEIGHWFHHRGQILFCGPRDIGNPLERKAGPEKQADQFASDMILPTFMVKPLLAKIKRPTLKAVRDIANEFDASDTATLLKLIDLDHFPIMAICHGKTGRRWFRRSPMIAEWWFPRSELDPKSHAFEMLFGKARELAIPQKLAADAWFEFRNVDRFEVSEQSFRLPNDEILTLLILPPEATN